MRIKQDRPKNFEHFAYAVVQDHAVRASPGGKSPIGRSSHGNPHACKESARADIKELKELEIEWELAIDGSKKARPGT